MLTPKQNFLEAIKPGGRPERFVNQYEFMGFVFGPSNIDCMPPEKGGPDKKMPWGYTLSFRADQPGAFPVHTPDKICIQDFDDWKDYVKAPKASYSDAEWEPFIAQAEQIPRDQIYAAAFIAPGIFELIHYLGEMTNAMCAFYENPDEVKELIKYILDWEIELCDDICAHVHPDAVLSHDDWGSRTSTFLSPEMFEEFFLDAWKTLYSRWHENGTEIVVHHSDSYGATLVPYMIDMGINVWQGVMSSNDIPELIKKYGEKITFMGGLDGADVEKEDWTDEFLKSYVVDICKQCGPNFFIPCLTQGLPMSVYDGIYESISKAISECSEEMPEFFK